VEHGRPHRASKGMRGESVRHSREVARSPEMYRSYIEERVGQPPVWSSVATGADGRPVPGAAVPRETSSPSG